jgi:hypothetical protein
MAVGIPTINLFDRGPKPGRGIKALAGRIGFSANSTFVTCGIEKYFRKCTGIYVNVKSGILVQWNNSTTHRAGLLRAFMASSYSTTLTDESCLAQSVMPVCSGTFTAFGL